MPLYAGEDIYHPIKELPQLSAPERVVVRFWPPAFGSGDLQLPEGITEETSVPVIVNYGRWLVQCPWCPSAQVASREDHRFFCIECANNQSMKWIRVTWPDTHVAVERLLGKRHMREIRNWLPHETLEHLRAENELRGVE